MENKIIWSVFHTFDVDFLHQNNLLVYDQNIWITATLYILWVLAYICGVFHMYTVKVNRTEFRVRTEATDWQNRYLKQVFMIFYTCSKNCVHPQMIPIDQQ